MYFNRAYEAHSWKLGRCLASCYLLSRFLHEIGQMSFKLLINKYLMWLLNRSTHACSCDKSSISE